MRSLRHLNKYFWKYKWRLILGILFAVSSTYFGIYVAILVRKATDFMTHAVANHYSFEVTARELLEYGLLILGTTIISGFLMFLMRQAIIVMSRHIEYDLKNEIFAHYQSLDMAFYRRNNTGDMMNRISEDVSRVRMYIGPAVMYFASTLATIVLVAATMTGVNAMLSTYVLLPLPILVVVIYFVSDLINKLSNSVQEQLSGLSTIAQESFSGIRVLKAYAQEESSGNSFARESGLYRKKYLGLTMTEALFSPFILLLIGISTVLTIYIGGKQAIDRQISYGNIVEFIIYVGKLTWPVAALGWVTSLVQRAAASQTRINEFLNTTTSIIPLKIGSQPVVVPEEGKVARASFPPSGELEGALEFQNVTFVYPDSGIKAMDNISFKVPAGQSLAIIGKTGSGKSSVAALICRLYDVTEGKILVDGKDLKDCDLSLLRRQIGYVPQDTFLFSDTVAGNISFGVHSEPHAPNPELIEQAAKDAGIEGEILRFPDKYKTMIGERGITLSGGQKQRIAIARAIIGSPRILIFDDCLSAVDTETEAEILGNLRNVMRDKTTILISHRVSTVKDASHIIALNNGKIEEEGSHQQLMDKKGFYYELYQMQLAEEQKGNS
ncbi:MAG: ABC transporter ATP-binding protein [Bacteroidetes bacterium]|nr:MAG: ABC transporter ATP-binding protein [Bacteroidota bacterium]